MKLGIKFRLTIFALVIVLAELAFGWATHTSWNRFRELSDRLDQVQAQSFQTADQFRARLRQMKTILLRHGAKPDPANLGQFETEWTNLDQWIDAQQPRSEQEREILAEINVTHDAYYAVATNLLATTGGTEAGGQAILSHIKKVDQLSDKQLELGFRLLEARRESLSRSIVESRNSVTSFRSLFISELIVLLGSGVWVAVMVYRGLISPLKLKLVESHALIERQEKLASLGMLAAGVAHEIRNPLTAIKARLFTLQKLLKTDSVEQADADVIGREIGRLERIVKDFLLFARPSEPELVTVDANEPLREVQVLLTPQLAKSNIRLALEESPTARIRIDPEQIKQVLINLVQNGADAIGQNGTVTLRARLDSKRLAERTIPVVILEVADTGKGIPPDVQNRLFDPFFSTKDAGTGLGLSIAARIIQKHGGALQYQTRVNCGTTFGIVLPRAAVT